MVTYQIPHVANWTVQIEEPHKTFYRGEEKVREVDDDIHRVYGDRCNGFLAAAALMGCGLSAKQLRGLRLIKFGSNRLMTLVFPKGGLESERIKGYYHIPGFSKCLVSKETPHKFIDLNGKVKRISQGSDGYLNVCVIREHGSGFVSLRAHRLVLLAFDHGGSFPNMEANHRDLDRRNYSLSNLDWLTPSQNQFYTKAVMKYGYDPNVSSIDLIERYLNEREPRNRRSINNRGRQLRVFDAYSGELVITGIPAEIARFLEVDLSLLGAHLRSDFPGKTIKKKYRVHTTNEEFCPDSELTKSTHSRRLEATDVLSGEVSIFASASSFVTHSGLTRKQVFGRLDRGSVTPCNGWTFKYLD